MVWELRCFEDSGRFGDFQRLLERGGRGLWAVRVGVGSMVVNILEEFQVPYVCLFMFVFQDSFGKS